MTAEASTQRAPSVVAIGSCNPAKLAAARWAVGQLLSNAQVLAAEVESAVPEQPWGDEQTAEGALIRARAARLALDADYGLGIESGLADGPGGRIYVISWAVAVDRRGATGYGASERFALPPSIGERLRRGAELGPLLAELTGQPELARREGAVGVLTGGRRSRSDILGTTVLHALVTLLAPWHERVTFDPPT